MDFANGIEGKRGSVGIVQECLARRFGFSNGRSEREGRAQRQFRPLQVLLGRTLVVLVGVGVVVSVSAAPKCVYLIRHAEKPEGKSDHLSEVGFVRASLLGQIFEAGQPMSEFERPDVFIAAAHVPGETSLRSIETLVPLATEEGAQVITRFRREQFKKLARWLLKSERFEGQVVIVAWPHSELYRLARRLGGRPSKPWKNEVFDRVWVIDFETADHPMFYDVPQSLFPGDSR